MSLRPLFQDMDSIARLLAEDVAILTPNRRLSRAIREAEALERQTSGQTVWPSSTVLPLRQYWIERWRFAVTRGFLAPYTLLDSAAQRLVWRQVIDQDSEGRFSLLSPTRAAALCQEASERLALWRIDPGDADTRQLFSFDEDSMAFLRWEKAFRSVLKDMDAMTPEQALEALLNCPEAMDQAVAIMSDDDLPPLHDALCRAAGECHRVAPPRQEGRVLPLRGFSEPRAELQAAARWCREQYLKDPGGRYAVVLSDMQNDRDRLEFFLRQEFDCLSKNYASLPVNFATGFRLDRVPLVRDALRILELSLPEVTVETVITLLQSRFVSPFKIHAEKREASLRRLRELARERVPQHVLHGVLEELFDRSLGAPPWDLVLQRSTNGAWQKRARSPSQWLEPFKAILNAWGWPYGTALDSLEYQQAVQWRETLDAFAAQDHVVAELSLAEAIQSLRELLGEQQFQPRTDDQAVQVLGPLETTGLQFDALWITGMSADRWPAAAQPNPYLPHSLQRQSGMPHADAAWERRWAEARWTQWLQGATEIQISYVNLVDGSEVLPSSLLSDGAVTAETSESRPDDRWLTQRAASTFESLALAAVPVSDEERVSQGVGTSVLEQQSACPFLAFAAARLAATPLPAPVAGLLPSERGTLLHRALYTLWGEIKDSENLHRIDESELEAVIDAAVGFALQGIDKARLDVLGGALLDLEQQRLRRVLLRWLEVERARDEGFTVVAREEPREHVLGGLRLRLRLDRVDELSDGSTVIVDYKSGSPGSVSQWLGDRPARPQLPLYALLEPFASGIAYASLKPGMEGFKGIGKRAFEAGIASARDHVDDDGDGETQDAPENAMEALRGHWRKALAELAEEFIGGISPVDPTVEACRYCQRFSLCRLGEELL
ncbi:PD-(D/E)XK nuclease family protein [Congregibacter litoralis]|uniref:Putative DNA repair protein n=1 Tax=Congregibacter litoralis KT71 TaxID=314285 RepID=A4A4G8_9GAMM|nr:PD-(D/E)XK nuclease family protein [Congregibacter litoralis]EAQ99103.2 putative DNA repair protein [Congregibacter litoralis KT71]